jgi:hypothetical protein
MSKFTRGDDLPAPAGKPVKQPRVRQPKQVFTPDMTAPVGIMRSECFEFIKGRGRSLLCPLCDQRMQRYKRSVNRKMVEALFKLYKKNLLEDGRWVPVQEIYTKGSSGDYAKLRHWGLIEAGDKRRAYRNSVGYWRITDLGKLFAEGKVTIKKFAIIYDNNCVGFEGDDVNVASCFGENFSYPALMAR